MSWIFKRLESISLVLPNFCQCFNSGQNFIGHSSFSHHELCPSALTLRSGTKYTYIYTTLYAFSLSLSLAVFFSLILFATSLYMREEEKKEKISSRRRKRRRRSTNPTSRQQDTGWDWNSAITGGWDADTRCASNPPIKGLRGHKDLHSNTDAHWKVNQDESFLKHWNRGKERKRERRERERKRKKERETGPCRPWERHKILVVLTHTKNPQQQQQLVVLKQQQQLLVKPGMHSNPKKVTQPCSSGATHSCCFTQSVLVVF